MRQILFFFIACAYFMPYTSQAQQDAMFSRYMFNTMYLFNNPAYSGSHDYWTTNALYRTQWLRFDGAPQTLYLGGEGLVGRRQNAGIGGSLYHDKIGLDRISDFSANYAYHLRLNKEQTLSIGLKAGAFYYKSMLSQAVVWDGTDPVYTGGDISGLVPRAGLGIYWYGPNHFAGLSVPTLIAFDKRTTFNLDLDKAGLLRRHYYLYGGYVFRLQSGIDLKPSVLLKYQPAAPLEADINLNIWFKNLFSVGASYRTNDAVSVMFEIPIGKRLSIGYAFDNTITAISNVSSGTHELMVGYNFVSDLPGKRPTNYRPINRF